LFGVSHEGSFFRGSVISTNTYLQGVFYRHF
jgi:hypothetical protein